MNIYLSFALSSMSVTTMDIESNEKQQVKLHCYSCVTVELKSQLKALV